MNTTILVVEDHCETREMLKAVLEDAGFCVFCTSRVKAAKDFLKQNCPSVIVLDLHLPDGSGLDICRQVRLTPGQESVPIIALTGQDGFEDKQRGFTAGVDQYLTKPIIMDELVLWVQSLLRRVAMDKSGGAHFVLGALHIDVNARIVKYKNSPVAGLTGREFDLLLALAKSSPRIVSRREILEKIWYTVAVPNLVDTHMFNLRSKLPPELSHKIQAVPAKGFRYLD